MPERMARVETKVTHIEATVDAIRETQIELRDALIGQKAVRSAAKDAFGFIKAVAPTAIAVGGAAAAVIGLR
ncbi:MAG: hypothetical protein ACJ8AD_14820 [Gemmatimonadaceae bacterium]